MKILSILLLFILSYNLNAIGHKSQKAPYEIFAGLSLKKYNSFYWENGFIAKYYHKYIGASIGTSYETTLLGSAINSNALTQHNFNVFFDKDFNIYNNLLFINPRLNIGYFYVDYESQIFNELDNNTLTVSPEVILRLFKSKYTSDNRFNFELTLGYNIFHGNGENGIGSLYPLYFRFNLLYQLTNNHKIIEVPCGSGYF